MASLASLAFVLLSRDNRRSSASAALSLRCLHAVPMRSLYSPRLQQRWPNNSWPYWRVQNHVRNTLATHETTRRFAELATDVVTGAAGYVPFAGGTAQFFREQAHDMLQAPYATLQESHLEDQDLVARLRDQLLSCEEELFEARRELRSSRSGAPAFPWADEASEALPTSTRPLDPEDTIIRLQSGEHALRDTFKQRKASLTRRELLHRISHLEETTRSRERDLAACNFRLAALKQELQLREKEIHSRERQATEHSDEDDPSVLRTRLEAAEERIQMLEDLLARALAAADFTTSASDKGELSGIAHGLHTPPASEKDAALPSIFPAFEPRLSRVPSTLTFGDAPARASRDHTPCKQLDAYIERDTPAVAPKLEGRTMPGGSLWLLEEAPPPELGTSLDTLPGTVDVHGQHFTTFSAVNDFEASQDHQHYMPGHWATPATASVGLPATDLEPSVPDSYRDDISMHSGLDGPIEHSLGVGIQIHYSLELAPHTPNPGHDDCELDMHSNADNAVEAHPKALEPLLIDSSTIKTEEDEAVTLTEEVENQYHGRRSRVESMHSTHTHHSVFGADISTSPERYLFDREPPKPEIDSYLAGHEHADSSDEELLTTLRPPKERGSRNVEEEEEVVIPPTPVKAEVTEEGMVPAPTIKQEDAGGVLSTSGTLEEVVRAGIVPRDESPHRTSAPIDEAAQVAAQSAGNGNAHTLQAVAGNDQLFSPDGVVATETPTPGHLVAKEHLFNDEPKSFSPSPTSPKSADAVPASTITVTSDTVKPLPSTEAVHVPATARSEVTPSPQQPAQGHSTLSDNVPEVIDKSHTIQSTPHTSRPGSPSDSGSDGPTPPSRTPQKKRTSSAAFKLFRAIHGTSNAKTTLADSNGESSERKSLSLTPDTDRRRNSGIHFTEREDGTERLSGVNVNGSTRGRPLSKSLKGKGKMTEIVEPMLGKEDKDKEAESQQHMLSATTGLHEHARSEPLAPTLKHLRPGLVNRAKERPQSRVFSVFGLDRKASSSEAAELGQVKVELAGSENFRSETHTAESETKVKRSSRLGLIGRFSPLRSDSKRNKDRAG